MEKDRIPIFVRKGIDLFYQINYNRKNTHRGEKGMARDERRHHSGNHAGE